MSYFVIIIFTGLWILESNTIEGFETPERIFQLIFTQFNEKPSKLV